MLRVLSDALTAADARQVTLIGLLDESAAFELTAFITHSYYSDYSIPVTSVLLMTNYAGRRHLLLVGRNGSPTTGRCRPFNW